MGVNSLPKTVTRQRRNCDLNPGPFAPQSSTLITRLPSHPRTLLLCIITHSLHCVIAFGSLSSNFRSCFRGPAFSVHPFRSVPEFRFSLMVLVDEWMTEWSCLLDWQDVQAALQVACNNRTLVPGMHRATSRCSEATGHWTVKAIGRSHSTATLRSEPTTRQRRRRVLASESQFAPARHGYDTDCMVCFVHRCKKTFLRLKKKFWSRFFTFLTFFNFPNVFFLKNVGKVQIGKQINKKHFQNNSNEMDLWFLCCMSNDLKRLPFTYLIYLTHYVTALKAISWASGVELNCTKKR